MRETRVSSGIKREYTWRPGSGQALVELAPRDSSGSGSGAVAGGLAAGAGGLKDRGAAVVQRTFFPDGGREAVSEDYWGFSFWTFIKSAVSASTSVLGTQGLLRAVGVGANASIASSAAINWVLKDGLGRIGCILAASIIGNKFDNDAKLFVFIGDMMYGGLSALARLSPLSLSLLSLSHFR